MRNPRQQLEMCRHGRLCLVGIGNVDLGDDGFGVRLAQELKVLEETEAPPPSPGALASEQPACGGKPQSRVCVIEAGTTPERFLGSITAAGFDHVVFLDAVDLGSPPGAAAFLSSGAITTRFPQISTHKLSLGLLAQSVESNGKTKAWLLGVQPESLESGKGLSAKVQRTSEILQELFEQVFQPAAQMSIGGTP